MLPVRRRPLLVVARLRVVQVPHWIAHLVVAQMQVAGVQPQSEQIPPLVVRRPLLSAMARSLVPRWTVRLVPAQMQVAGVQRHSETVLPHAARKLLLSAIAQMQVAGVQSHLAPAPRLPIRPLWRSAAVQMLRSPMPSPSAITRAHLLIARLPTVPAQKLARPAHSLWVTTLTLVGFRQLLSLAAMELPMAVQMQPAPRRSQ